MDICYEHRSPGLGGGWVVRPWRTQVVFYI
jgi:hypothetical protein